jgi:hypothetical protein
MENNRNHRICSPGPGSASDGLVRREFGYPFRILYCDAVFPNRFGTVDYNFRHLHNGWSPIIDLKGRGPAWLGPFIPLGVRWPNYLAAVASFLVVGFLVLKLADTCIAIRRRRRGLCPKCAYPLASGICPECGTQTSMAQ